MAKKSNQTIDLGFLKGEETRPRTTDLSGLFAQSVTTATEMQQAIMVRVDRLLNNPYQPRQEIRDDSIEELAGVIRAQGFQGVLVARPVADRSGFYQLTAGHRRREAAKRAGMPLLPVVVRDLTEEEMVTLAITENIQREDLTPLEEGKIYLLMSDEMGYTHEQIAREIGRKRGYIENRIRVARAPKDVQELIQSKPDSIRAVATLIKVKDPAERAEIINMMLAGTLTVEDLPGYIASKSAGRNAQVGTTDDSSQAHRPTTDNRAKTDQSAIRLRPSFAGSGPSESAIPRAGHEDRSVIRIGNAKLAAVLRYLNTYRDAASGRQSISEQEQASLANIKAIADELYVRFAK
jgi:ParB family chromosome partitioning protein